MIRPVVRDVFSISQKSEPATQSDFPVSADLRNTLKANQEHYVGIRDNRPLEIERSIVW